MAKWYYYDGVRKVGPISSEDLKVLADMAHIGVGTIVEAEDGRQTMARNIKGLFSNPPQPSMFEEVPREPLVAESPAPPIQTPQPPLPPRAPSTDFTPNPGLGSSTFGFPPEEPKSEPAPKRERKSYWKKPQVEAGPYPELQTRVLKFIAAWWNIGVGIFTGIGLLIAVGIFIGGTVNFVQLLDIDSEAAFEFLLGALFVFVPSFLGFAFCIAILYLIGQAVRTWLKYDYCLNLQIKKEEEK